MLLLAGLVLPVALWVAWSDMARMTIPNRAVLTLIAIFVLAGPLVLPWAELPGRAGQFLAVLVVGFVLNAAGLMGAGDAKFAAAMAPFVAPQDGGLVMVLFAGLLPAALLLHRTVRATGPLRALAPGWASWQRRDFPLGLALGPGLVFYLLLAGTGP